MRASAQYEPAESKFFCECFVVVSVGVLVFRKKFPFPPERKQIFLLIPLKTQLLHFISAAVELSQVRRDPQTPLLLAKSKEHAGIKRILNIIKGYVGTAVKSSK